MCSRCKNNHCKDNKCKKKKVYDVIIVGGGTAGGVCARKIIDFSPGLSVLVLEAGTNQNENPVSQFPFGFSEEMKVTNFLAATYDANLADTVVSDVWSYQFGNPFFSLGANNLEGPGVPGPSIFNSTYDKQIEPYTQGHCWGGASLHNYLLAVRSSPQYADYLGSLVDPANVTGKWNSTHFLEVYKAIETYWGNPAPDATRGLTGPYGIYQSYPPQPFNADVLLPIMQANGFVDDSTVPIGLDYNANVNRLFATNDQLFFIENQPGVRSQVAQAFLTPDVVNQETGCPVNRSGLTIKSKATVNKINFCNTLSGIKAKSVSALVNGKNKKYYGKKIILTAGGLRTPGILERSGVGNPEVLEKAGVEKVWVANDRVGENFQNHTGPLAIFTINPDIWFEVASQPTAVTISALKVTNTIPYTNGANVVERHTIIGVQPGAGIPSANGINNALYDCLEGGDDFGFPITSNFFGFPGFTAIVENLQPTSLGYIHIVSSDPFARPRFNPSVNTSEEDQEFNSEAYKYIREFVNDLAVAEYNSQPVGAKLVYPPEEAFESDEKLRRYVASGLIPYAHFACTVAMDTIEQPGVLNNRLHVKGIENLMVADLSAFPKIPDANTTLPAALMGWIAAEIVAEDFA